MTVTMIVVMAVVVVVVVVVAVVVIVVVIVTAVVAVPVVMLAALLTLTTALYAVEVAAEAWRVWVEDVRHGTCNEATRLLKVRQENGRLSMGTAANTGATGLACCEGKRTDQYVFECERPHEYGSGKCHGRDWVIAQVHRVCDETKVPRMTAHGMRGVLATISAERGMAGHLIAATMGHEDPRTTMNAYAAPGAAASGARRVGLVVLAGGRK